MYVTEINQQCLTRRISRQRRPDRDGMTCRSTYVNTSAPCHVIYMANSKGHSIGFAFRPESVLASTRLRACRVWYAYNNLNRCRKAEVLFIQTALCLIDSLPPRLAIPEFAVSSILTHTYMHRTNAKRRVYPFYRPPTTTVSRTQEPRTNWWLPRQKTVVKSQLLPMTLLLHRRPRLLLHHDSSTKHQFYVYISILRFTFGFTYT